MVISLLEFIRDGENKSQCEAHYRLGLAIQAAFHCGCAVGCKRADENLQVKTCVYDTETGELMLSLWDPEAEDDTDDSWPKDIIH